MPRNRRWIVIVLAFLVSVLVACVRQLPADTVEKTIYVGPTLVDCEGEGPQKCLQVKENPEDEYSLFYDPIEGFDYEQGYQYELRVGVDPVPDPPAGASSLRYTLIEVVSKEPAEVVGEEAAVLEKTIYVGPLLVDCVGVGPQKCMLVKENPEDAYRMFYDRIAGFDYEQGYEYELRVQVETVPDPPADASSLRYTLVEVVSKRPALEGGSWALEQYVDGDGQPEIAVGSADHNAYLLDASGRERWRQTLPHYLHEPFARVVTTADLGLEEGSAVIVGGKNCHVHAFSPAGVELWRHEVIHGVKDLAPVDMTGDGLDEILAVTDWSTYQCIDAAGKGLWPVWKVHSRYGRGTNVVRGADIDGDGTPEMICGAIDSCVYAFGRGGDLLWEFFTGEEISALAFLDLDGDRVPETIAGAMNGYVYALDARGHEIWHRGLGEEVNSIAILPGATGPLIVVGTDGPVVTLRDACGQVRSTVDTGSPVRKLIARATPSGAALYLIHREGRVAFIDGI